MAVNNLPTLNRDTLHRHIVDVLRSDPLIAASSVGGMRLAAASLPVDVSGLLDIGDPAEFVRQIYLTVFSRDAQPAELAEHIQQLSRISRAYLLEDVVNKAIAANPRLIIVGRWRPRTAAELSALSGAELVNEAFRTLLWRAPTFEEYVRYLWAVDRLGSAKAFLAELVSVPEARQYPPLEGFSIDVSELAFVQPREALITRAYRSILGRDPDAEGFKAAISALRWLPRKRYLIAVATSAEARNRPAIFTWRGRPLDGRSLRDRGRLKLATLVDSLLGTLYRRVVSVETQLCNIVAAQSAIQNDVSVLQTEQGSVRRAFEAAQSEWARTQRPKAVPGDARFETSERFVSKAAADNSRTIRDIRKLASHVSGQTGRLEMRARTLQERVGEIAEGLPSPSIAVGDRLLVSRVSGFAMVMPAEDVLLTSMLTMYGSVDSGLQSFFARALRPGMIFVDVGAHIGIHTLGAASLVGDAGRVYSFEPAPRLFDILTKNVVLNGFSDRVIASCTAVSKTAGTSPFLIKQQTGHNTLFGPQAEGDAVIEVKTVVLDEALAGLSRIDFVKIDAEGAEPAVLDGMRQLLQRHPDLQLVIEFAPALLRWADVEPAAFARELEKCGFSLRRIDDVSGELSAIRAAELLSVESSNVLLARA